MEKFSTGKAHILNMFTLGLPVTICRTVMRFISPIRVRKVFTVTILAHFQNMPVSLPMAIRRAIDLVSNFILAYLERMTAGGAHLSYSFFVKRMLRASNLSLGKRPAGMGAVHWVFSATGNAQRFSTSDARYLYRCCQSSALFRAINLRPFSFLVELDLEWFSAMFTDSYHRLSTPMGSKFSNSLSLETFLRAIFSTTKSYITWGFCELASTILADALDLISFRGVMAGAGTEPSRVKRIGENMERNPAMFTDLFRHNKNLPAQVGRHCLSLGAGPLSVTGFSGWFAKPSLSRTGV